MAQLDKFCICVCYIISTLLITVFVYSLISSNIQNTRKLERLKEDIDEIALVVLHTPASGKEPQHLSELVDKMLMKRLAGIWDVLYSIKKSLKGGSEINDSGREAKSKGESTAAKTEDRVNYAAEELGARIMHVKAEPVCSQNFFKTWMSIEFSSNPPIRMLRSSLEPGSCFAYKGDKADVTIQLAHEIIVDQVAVQHIAKTKSPTDDTSSAPKEFHIMGIRRDFSEFSLGKFRFDNIPERLLQYFNISPTNRFEYLRFQFESNHGHPNYTCIYRIAVYGKL